MGDITLRKAVEEYKDIYMASRNFSPGTRVMYLNAIEDLIQFLEQLGIKEVKDISLQQLERYLAELDHRGVAGSTRKRKVVSIRSFLWYLYQDNYIRINLGKRLIPPFVAARPPRYLAKLEYEQLLIACAKNLRDFALIQLLLQTGIKLSELIRLTISDLELNPNSPSYLHILGGKTKKIRLIPLKINTYNALVAYLRERNLAPNTILFTNRFEQPLSPRGVEKIVSKYMTEVGIKNASIQSLRHTFAVQTLASGSSTNNIMEIMGLSKMHIIDLYPTIIRNRRAN